MSMVIPPKHREGDLGVISPLELDSQQCKDIVRSTTTGSSRCSLRPAAVVVTVVPGFLPWGVQQMLVMGLMPAHFLLELPLQSRHRLDVVPLALLQLLLD